MHDVETGPIRLYSPRADRPMQVVVFGSGSGTNLEALLKAEKESPNPSYQIKALFTDRDCRIQDIGKREHIPVITYSFQRFFEENPKAQREEYEERIIDFLLALEIEIDLIVLAGYMRLLSPRLLQKFPKKIINVHPGDLVDKKYTGIHAVQNALEAGEKRTRSCVILVDEGEDTGPILAVGPWVEVREGETVKEHQARQKKESDWPVLVETVQKISMGEEFTFL